MQEAIRDHAFDTSERLHRHGSEQTRRLQQRGPPLRPPPGQRLPREEPSDGHSITHGRLSDWDDMSSSSSSRGSSGSIHYPDPIFGRDRYESGSRFERLPEESPQIGDSSGMKPDGVNRGFAADAAAARKDYSGGRDSRPWINGGNPDWATGSYGKPGDGDSFAGLSSGGCSRFGASNGRSYPRSDPHGSGGNNDDANRCDEERPGFGPFGSYRSGGGQHGSHGDSGLFAQDGSGVGARGNHNTLTFAEQSGSGGAYGGGFDKDDGTIRDFRSDVFRDLGDIGGRVESPAGCPALRNGWH